MKRTHDISSSEIRLVPAGDSCVLVVLGTVISAPCNDRVHRLRRALGALQAPWLRALVPGYCTLAVVFDPLLASPQDVRELVRQGLEEDAGTAETGRTVTIPVCYGGAFGPDLPAVCRRSGLPAQEVIRRHSAALYRCAMLGFLPGFPYLLGLDPQLATPRLATPRTSVPAGAVGIAGTQTGIYPLASPGGWNVIGRTPLPLFDGRREQPALLEPGDRVQFRPITEEQFRNARQQLSTSYPPFSTTSAQVMHITVREPGLLTTVQDPGRGGFQELGVPVAGTMDPQALALGNLLVGNPPDAAGLEMTITGPELLFDGDGLVAVTGAVMPLLLNGVRVPLWTALPVRRGDVLALGTAAEGCRAWLCVAGGIAVPPVLGSRSTLLRAGLGGLEGRALRAGDLLPLGALPPDAGTRAWLVCPPELRTGTADAIPVLPGPQAEALSPGGRERFLAAEWIISPEADRMGYRLEGPPLELAGSADIISEYVPAGAIQVTGAGQPIILLADRQTTGGYAKPFVVAGAALGVLAQARPGDRLRFRLCTPGEARALIAQQQEARQRLAAWQWRHGGTLLLNLGGQRYAIPWEERDREES